MKKIMIALSLCLPGIAQAQDVEYEDIWIVDGAEYTSHSAGCAAFPVPESTDFLEYDGAWSPDTWDESCKLYQTSCGYSSVTVAQCPADGLTQGFQRQPIVKSQRIKEEALSCADRAGESHSTSFSHYFDSPAPDMSGLTCSFGCATDVDINTTTEYEDFGDGWEPAVEHYDVTLTMNGLDCAGNEPDPPETPSGVPEKDDENNCTADYYTSPVTGSIVCGQPPISESDDNGTTTTEEVLPDGTEVETVTRPDGSSTQTTKHPDGSTTTTTTTAGGQTSTEYDSAPDDDGEEEEDECPSNQWTLKNGQMVCKTDDDDEDNGSASGGGSCSTEPECSGDAIMCAVLKQQWLARCESELPSETEILVETGLEGLEPTELDDGEFGIAESFDTDGFLGATQSCAPAVAVTVAGVNLEFSFDPLCTLAGYISPLVLLSGLLIGTRVVVGAF